MAIVFEELLAAFWAAEDEPQMKGTTEKERMKKRMLGYRKSVFAEICFNFSYLLSRFVFVRYLSCRLCTMRIGVRRVT
jgi:hypothetical protein